jgi:hypothetical protein
MSIFLSLFFSVLVGFLSYKRGFKQGVKHEQKARLRRIKAFKQLVNFNAKL